MIELDPVLAVAFITARINRVCCPHFGNQIPAIIHSFIQFDSEYMDGLSPLQGHAESMDTAYDEDDAFEYILDAYLAQFPLDDELSMEIAALLDQYMLLIDQYLQSPVLIET